MKTLKKVLAGMMVMMMFASVLTVSAADSKEQGVKVVEEQSGYYQITEGQAQFAGVSQEVLTQIQAIDKGTLTSLGTDIQNKLAGKTSLCKVFDLDALGNHPNCPPHKINLVVDALTASCSEVVVLHYSQARNLWEVITPKKVDIATKTISIEMQDLSPVVIFAKVSGSTGSSTSPSTGAMSYSWMLWAAAALVVAGTGVVVSQKKNRQ